MVKKIILLICFLPFVWLLTGCQDNGEFAYVNTNYVKKSLNDSNVIIVDARNNNWFIGWKEEGVARGGHVTGATDFSADWLAVFATPEKLKIAMKDKQLFSAKELIVYDSNGKDAQQVAAYFKAQGINQIKLYNVKEWAADSTLPMQRYPNYHLVVPPQFIKAVLEGKTAETLTKNSKIKFFEVSRGDESAYYNKGHIPTSVHMDTNEVESIPAWRIDSVDKVNTYLRLLNTDRQLFDWVKKYEITPDTTVILSSERQNATYRVAIILRYLGVKDVRVLNGGLDAYKRAGFALETERHASQPIKEFDLSTPGQPDLIDNIEKAKQILASSSSLLVDVRMKEEYLGNISGYKDLSDTGRPKGIVFHGGSKGESPSDVFDYRNVDNTVRNRDEVLAMWQKAGIEPQKKHLSFMCGSGWRTAEVLTYAQVYGFENTSMYSDGWVEWSHDALRNPIEYGE